MSKQKINKNQQQLQQWLPLRLQSTATYHCPQTGDLASQWKKYKQIWDSIEIVTGVNGKTNAYQTAMFIMCIGSEALEIFNGLPFENEGDKNDLNYFRTTAAEVTQKTKANAQFFGKTCTYCSKKRNTLNLCAWPRKIK